MTATMSYSTDSSTVSLLAPLEKKLHHIDENLRNALGMLQFNGACCNSFTVLRCTEFDATTPVVELRRIEASSVIRLMDALNATETWVDTDKFDLLSKCAEENIAEVADVELPRRIRFTDPDLWLEDIEHTFHRASLAMQVFCAALSSYGRAHIGERCPFFHARTSRLITVCKLAFALESPEGCRRVCC